MSNDYFDYKALYNTSPCGYFCSTPKGEIIESNKRFAEFTGYTQEEIIGKKKIADFLTPAGKIYLQTHFFPVLLFKGIIEEISFDFVKKDGSTFPVLVNSIIVKDDNENTKYIQTTIFNISQRKSYEKELLIAKRNSDTLSAELLKSNEELKISSNLILNQKLELEKLNKHLENKNSQLSDFAHIVSHNLRSPVFNLHTLLDFYKESPSNDDKKMYINTIKQVANQMDETLNELIDSIKIQEEFLITKEKIVFEDILKKIMIMLSGDIKETGAEVTYDFSDVNTIIYSKVYLKSAMLNLLSNAIKYKSPDRKPKIHFQTEDINDKIVLKVTDNGLGIDIGKHRNDLFGFNKTFHNHPNSKGMGLYMTRIQIEAMGGKIWLDSELNKGTTFKITFRKDL